MMHIETLEEFRIRKDIVLILVAIILIQPLIPQSARTTPLEEAISPRGFLLESQYTEMGAIDITSETDFPDSGFSGEGTEVDPYVLDNVIINVTQAALSISETSVHFVIQDCVLYAGFVAIVLNNVSNGVIEDCEIRASSAGISLFASEYIIIRDCDISLADSGILANSLDFGIISRCTFHHNDFGINYVQGNSSQINSCTFYANTEYGLRLSVYSGNITVFQNDFGWNGVPLLGGVFLENNARDDGDNNTWISNRWSDFSSIPYLIAGGRSRDLSASLLADIVFPFVTSPDDLRYDEGETGNWVAWNATDEFPAEFTLLIDNNEIVTGSWLTETYNISVDGLELGSHNITIRFFDAAGNLVSDEVWVSVMSSIFGSEGTELVLYASLASIGSVIILIILIKRMR